MKTIIFLVVLSFGECSFAQSPVITFWLHNTSGKKGSYYVSGISTARKTLKY
jgi:hypothetical protein